MAGIQTHHTVDNMGDTQNTPAEIVFHRNTDSHNRPYYVPNQLWQHTNKNASTDITLPVDLNWTQPGRTFQLHNRQQRARCYEIILREGTPDDIIRIVDSTLLVDLWEDLTLPREIRDAWQPIINKTFARQQ